MGRINDTKEKGRGFGSKGFYAALALCLVGTGVTAWIAVNSTVKEIEETVPQGESSLEPLTSRSDTLSGAGEELEPMGETEDGEEEELWSYPDLEQADTKSEDVPVESSGDGESQDSSWTSSSSSSSSDSSAVSSETGDGSAQSVSSQNVLYMLPVSGEILTQFSGGELVKDPTMGDWRTHDGIDIKAAAATPVKAAGSGKISKIYRDGMWGNVVEITHADGVTSIYCGLNDEMPVKAGDSVEIGQTIGSVAEKITAEVALEPHLHFAMKKDGGFVDPMVMMGKE